jgi:hypothetical protein
MQFPNFPNADYLLGLINVWLMIDREWLVMYEIPKVYKHWWTWQRASLVTLTFGLQSFPSSLTVMLHFISCAVFWPSEFGSRIY